jgi:hypothetical protein
MLPVMHDLIEQLLKELSSHPKRAYMRGKSNMNIGHYLEVRTYIKVQHNIKK